MLFSFRNATSLELLNAHKKYKHINNTLYKKALSHLKNGYDYQLVVDNSKEPFKVVKVLKGNKL